MRPLKTVLSRSPLQHAHRLCAWKCGNFFILFLKNVPLSNILNISSFHKCNHFYFNDRISLNLSFPSRVTFLLGLSAKVHNWVL